MDRQTLPDGQCDIVRLQPLQRFLDIGRHGQRLARVKRAGKLRCGIVAHRVSVGLQIAKKATQSCQELAGSLMAQAPTKQTPTTQVLGALGADEDDVVLLQHRCGQAQESLLGLFHVSPLSGAPCPMRWSQPIADSLPGYR
jgi:hypothetical protein